MNDFKHFFKRLADREQRMSPYPWQEELAGQTLCTNRLIRIPTGFGKTLGILSSWLWNRVERKDDQWPRRLVWCLPMRVLVEQTYDETCACLSRLGVLWDNISDHSGKIGVHLLMGGADAGEWQIYPEHCSVLIGTQDMLLSRAMNRGYGCPRARWPLEFGALNQDCLWVMDEVQLMDVGLATSAQLQAFRDDDTRAGRMMRLCVTWWMSATLQPAWLTKSPDTQELGARLTCTGIPRSERKGHLWEDVTKPFRVEKEVNSAEGLAEMIGRAHLDTNGKPRGLTLSILNTVDMAVAVFHALRRSLPLKDAGTDVRLIHSRFRPPERRLWRESFLRQDACGTGADRIIVSTQVVEAGVDISADLLVTELAPWASLVQRFGRCARWGGAARVIIVDWSKEKAGGISSPYDLEEEDAAREGLTHLSDVAPASLEAFEEEHPELLPRLYPFDPLHLLLSHELKDLFDTTTDLSGADIDISRYIRSGEERDIHVFWLPVPEKGAPSPEERPVRDSLCAVPVGRAKAWLFSGAKGNRKGSAPPGRRRSWVWDWLDGVWRRAEPRDLYPGQTVLVAADSGGYNKETGWNPQSETRVEPVPVTAPFEGELSDGSLEGEPSSASPWQTIGVHGRETGKIAAHIAGHLIPRWRSLYCLVGRWHDAGKGHPAFNGSITGPGRPDRRDLAKAPKEAWLQPGRSYPMKGEGRRAGFRHEVASTLALFSVLKRCNPDHAALLGPWREFLSVAGFNPDPALPKDGEPSPLEQEILDLTPEALNLAAYLICAHHGKVRVAWHAGPADQAANDAQLRILGLKDGDKIPGITLVDAEGRFSEFPGFSIDLSMAAAGLNPRTGMGWTERVLNLLDQYGPFTLAWLEALFRAADQRASRLSITDELLNPEVSQ